MKNIKKIIALLCFCLSTVSSAWDSYFWGGRMYVGADLSAMGLFNKNTFTSAVTGLSTYNTGIFGFAGGGFGGLVFNLPNGFDVSLEGFIDGTNLSLVNKNTINNIRISDEYNGGGRGLLGYEFLPGYDIHFLGGYVNGNFKYTDLANLIKVTKNLGGYQLGFGAQQQIVNGLFVRQDVLYNNFNKYTINYKLNRLSNLAGTLGLVYKFDNQNYSPLK